GRSYAPGRTLLDPLWVLGVVAIAVGGLLAARHPEEPAVTEEPGSRGAILPAGLFTFLLLSLVTSRLNHAKLDTIVTLQAGLMFSGGALVARSMLLGRRMRAMLERERSALASLAKREAELAEINTEL